jgi:hypothetical protein
MSYMPDKAPVPIVRPPRLRQGDPLLAEYRQVADYWRRLCGEICNATGDPIVKALCFDRDGIIIATETETGVWRNGKQVSEVPGWRWYATRGAAAELDIHARWAEYNLAMHEHKPCAEPLEDMPDRVAKHITAAKERAEAALRRRGEA